VDAAAQVTLARQVHRGAEGQIPPVGRNPLARNEPFAINGQRSQDCSLRADQDELCAR